MRRMNLHSILQAPYRLKQYCVYQLMNYKVASDLQYGDDMMLTLAFRPKSYIFCLIRVEIFSLMLSGFQGIFGKPLWGCYVLHLLTQNSGSRIRFSCLFDYLNLHKFSGHKTPISLHDANVLTVRVTF